MHFWEVTFVTEENLKSHVEDIINALKEESKDEVSKDDLEKELEKFIEYGVPLDQAKQTLIKKYGGAAVLTSSTPAERTKIAELQPNQSSVKLLGHIIAINPKEVSVRGENRTIYYGILGDESGTIPFTSWGSMDVEKGDVVEISNAYTREWQGAVQLNLGDRVHIEKTDKDSLPKEAYEPKEMKVNDLRSGLGRVDVTARILEINSRDTDVNGESRKVFSGVLADETGKAQFTSWHDFDIKEGDVLRIAGGYVKSWKGIPQLTFDSNASVKKLEKSKVAEGELEANKMPLYALVEKGGALDIEVEGAVIDIRPGSGLIYRCPECKRVIQESQCNLHGKVEGTPDLRIKLILDDGTGAVGAILNREVSEKILGMSFNDLKKMKQDDLLDMIKSLLFANRITLNGNALGDEFGTSVIVRDIKLVELNVNNEAEKIANELEELL
jgi:replication factor A1